MDEVMVSAAEYERLRRLAYTDELTGLRNRNALNEAAAAIEGSYAVLLIDVDHFKELNDTHGHQAGDAFLAVVGKGISAVVRHGSGRAHDYVGYRRSGDEFVVLLPGASRIEACLVSERIRGAIMALSLDIPSTTVTIGMAEGDRTYEAVERDADHDLYRRKANRTMP